MAEALKPMRRAAPATLCSTSKASNANNKFKSGSDTFPPTSMNFHIMHTMQCISANHASSDILPSELDFLYLLTVLEKRFAISTMFFRGMLMELFSDKPGDEGLPGSQRLLAMIAVMTTTTMTVFDASMINIALPKMAHELGVTAGAAVWISNSYLLATAMLLAVFAAVATKIGFRKQFIGALLLFTLASLGCALASSLSMLIAMRVLQGIGSAAALSISPAMLRSIFPNRLLGRILALNALLIATNSATAPIVGGTLLSVFGWQWLFAINIPLGLVALMLTIKAIPTHKSQGKEPFDTLGGILSAIMLGSVIMAASGFSKPGGQALSAETLLTGLTYAVIAILSGMAFVWRQKRAPKPLLPLAIFRSLRFSLAALTSCTTFMSQGITFIALPFLFQNVYQYSVFFSALLFTPWPIGIILAAPIAGRLSDKYSAALISTIGLVIFAIGLMLLATLPEQAAIWDIALRSLFCGIGFGTFQSPNNRELLGNVSRENSGYASGILAIMRVFGQCLGTAFIGVILSICIQPNSSHLDIIQQEALGVQISLWVGVISTCIAICLSLTRLRQVRQQMRQTPSP